MLKKTLSGLLLSLVDVLISFDVQPEAIKLECLNASSSERKNGRKEGRRKEERTERKEQQICIHQICLDLWKTNFLHKPVVFRFQVVNIEEANKRRPLAMASNLIAMASTLVAVMQNEETADHG